MCNYLCTYLFDVIIFNMYDLGELRSSDNFFFQSKHAIPSPDNLKFQKLFGVSILSFYSPCFANSINTMLRGVIFTFWQARGFIRPTKILLVIHCGTQLLGQLFHFCLKPFYS